MHTHAPARPQSPNLGTLRTPCRLFLARVCSTAATTPAGRIDYHFHSEGVPLYLLTLFAKNERANLSKAERNELAELVGLLVAAWQEE